MYHRPVNVRNNRPEFDCLMTLIRELALAVFVNPSHFMSGSGPGDNVKATVNYKTQTLTLTFKATCHVWKRRFCW